LTTGPRTAEFEARFAEFLGVPHAVAVNSCTAAMHLAVDALELRRNQGVLVPTMTFAATAEVVRYQGAVPVLVDCDPVTLNMDLGSAETTLKNIRAGATKFPRDLEVVGIIPVHIGGWLMDMDAVTAFAKRHSLWIVEDAAHAFPAAARIGPDAPWRYCGQNTADATCFSFYANKPITTGEGGMVVTTNELLAKRMRTMSLHGISKDAWDRRDSSAPWDYRIEAPGFKYNLSDIASAIGNLQLARAESLRLEREDLARQYADGLRDVEEIELPTMSDDRLHSWHLYPIRLRLDRLDIDRDTFLSKLAKRGVGCSVHWRPLHLHPYYADNFGWTPEHFPVASSVWLRLISLPIFPEMLEVEQEQVIREVRALCLEHSKAGSQPRRASRY
jgi:perosamine synthetase